MEDPDWEIISQGNENFMKGVSVGYDSPIPRVPSVFPPKLKEKRFQDDTDFDPEPSNYMSAIKAPGELEKAFRAEESEGRMYVTTEARLRSEFPDRPLLIAAMGAVPKPDGSIRPVHDGTHFVHLNQGIRMVNQIQCPSAGEVGNVVRLASESKEAVFCLSIDISKAHRRVKIRTADHPLLCCKADSNSREVWVNRVGTFGVTSAAFWWARLFGLLGRFVIRCMLRSWFYHLVYVDDVHGVFAGEHKYLHLLMWLAAFEVVGTPFSLNKFQGGVEAQFVGYQVSYRHASVGLSKKRGDWVVRFIDDLEANNLVVQMRRFEEFVGRLAFVARILTWMKPYLAPLYSWKSALRKSVAATVPDMVWLVLSFLRLELKDCDYMVPARRRTRPFQEVFRTDAKCASSKIVLGGWEIPASGLSKDARWFSVVVRPEQAPYLFKPDGDSQWASASAELLATLFALDLFSCLRTERERHSLEISIPAGTDNQSNDSLNKKGSSPRWPLMLVNMQLCHRVSKAHCRLLLKWRPRSENQEADDLTNEDFRKFDLGKRIAVAFEDIDLSLLQSLWDARQSFLEARAQKISGVNMSRSKRRKLEKSVR